MESFQPCSFFLPPFSLVLLVLVAVFVSLLVTLFTTKQHYLNSTSTSQQPPSNTTAHHPAPAAKQQRPLLVQEPLPASERPRVVKHHPSAAQPIPIPTSPMVWHNSSGPDMPAPHTRTSPSSSLGARKGSSFNRCSWSSSSGRDNNNNSGSEESVAGSVGGDRETLFGNMGGQFEVGTRGSEKTKE
ncbi:hypothetical protein QBC36DRAFT_288392 [Triangularia setosa]|uniref:Uncharacterized protein n=1 Tax=Triangularia setosa TaxID=2587417 RepID=A0AAN6WCL9_9PEZI|nr:hypothetical protein QBC36DRAFT_288392 [Podospora setosa]